MLDVNWTQARSSSGKLQDTKQQRNELCVWILTLWGLHTLHHLAMHVSISTWIWGLLKCTGFLIKFSIKIKCYNTWLNIRSWPGSLHIQSGDAAIGFIPKGYRPILHRIKKHCIGEVLLAMKYAVFMCNKQKKKERKKQTNKKRNTQTQNERKKDKQERNSKKKETKSKLTSNIKYK